MSTWRGVCLACRPDRQARSTSTGHGGVTPASYRRGGAGACIVWTTVSSSIGRVLVAATAKGACFVAVGATDAELEAAIRTEFPCATLTRGSRPLLRQLAAAARAAARAKPVTWEMPADIVGTAFQWRVWRALTRIPPGRVASYAELAKTIGRPSAVRAVARACATNPLALVVPCHRVVGAGGELRGYRWGTERKGRLLLREQRLVRSAPRRAGRASGATLEARGVPERPGV